jgi:uncharacterized membrane protein
MREQGAVSEQQSTPETARDVSSPGEGTIPLPPGAETKLKEIGADPSDPRVRGALLLGAWYAGPIPPPSMLREYNEAVPGLGERIVRWVESQSEHRRALENLRTKGAEERMNRGQVLAAAVAAIGPVVAGVTAVFGNPWTAGIIAIVAVGGPTAAVALTRGRSPPVLPSSAVGTPPAPSSRQAAGPKER